MAIYYPLTALFLLAFYAYSYYATAGGASLFSNIFPAAIITNRIASNNLAVAKRIGVPKYKGYSNPRCYNTHGWFLFKCNFKISFMFGIFGIPLKVKPVIAILISKWCSNVLYQVEAL